MKVVLVYRKPRAEAYSIEELFHSIASELRNQIEIIEYEVGSRINIVRDVMQLRQLDADVYHVTGDVNYLINLLPRMKTILTVHDIGHFLFGLKGLKRWIYKWVWLVFPIRRASAVTAVSQETSQNIVDYLRIPQAHIKVIENCYSPIFAPVPKVFSEECPAILQVGTKSYKNIPRLIDSLIGINCLLVLIGKLDESVRNKLAKCGVTYENFVGITHEEIYNQYIKCDFVSFVSEGEGFGVPIIEAQAVGRPVITSNIPPMCDVAGKGACLVDPLDTSQIRKGIKRIISDAEYRMNLIEEGTQNVIRYSPKTISSQYLETYKSVASR